MKLHVNSARLELHPRATRSYLPCSLPAVVNGVVLFRQPCGRALQPNFPYGGHWSKQTRLTLSSRRKPCYLEHLTSLRVGNPPWPRDTTPPLGGHCRHKLQCEQASDICPYSGPGYLTSAAAHWNCLSLGTELNHRLCLQVHLHLPRPQTLLIENFGATMLHSAYHQERRCACRVCLNPHMRIHLPGP